MRKKRTKNPNFHGEIPKATWVEVKTKSRAGVEYTKHVQVFPPNPLGVNHLNRRRSKAKARRDAKLKPE